MDLVGLGASRTRSTSEHSEVHIKNAMCLYAYIEEPMGLLLSLCRGLSQHFPDADLERRDPSQRDRGGLEYFQTRVIDTKGLKSELNSSKPSQKKMKRSLVPRFDARDLCVKYKDVIWAKNVHLDRVCISEIGVYNSYEDEECVGVRYNDIASVSLPGVTWEPRPFEY